MSVESRIASRYLRTARKQRHAAVLSSISIGGIAIGVAALLISISLLSGLQGQIKARLIASSPQILIEPAGRNTIESSPAIIADAKRLGMTSVHPIVSGIGYGANDVAKRGRPVRIRSFEHGNEPPPTNARRAVIDPSESSIIVTREVASSLGLDLGQTITIVAPRTRLTPFGPMPVWRKYQIARFAMPTETAMSDAWLETREAESLFGTGGEPTSIEMYGPHERAEAIQSALAARYPRAQVKTWKEINRPLFLALRLEKIVMFATISLIIFVAALNLISSLSMLIVEKRPSVGVLRTLGSTERSILSIFMQVGLRIGLIGTLLGNILGIGVAWLANHYHLIKLPSDMAFFDYLPFALDVDDVIGVNVITLLLSVLATWYPARVASRLDPITAIREE
ncbi:MAG TPA: FtsX-like permease family protein [Thermoanaerobaculia bacterium]|nr:FtsX-like permease family protein [Thermoanaerobaculia bacterium]